jgi:hypothetical protein
MPWVDRHRRRLLLSAPLSGAVVAWPQLVVPTSARTVARVVVVEGLAQWPADRIAKYREAVVAGLPAGMRVEVAVHPFAADHHLEYATEIARRGEVDALVVEYFQAGELVSRVAGLRGLVIHAHAAQPDPRVPKVRALAASPVCFVSTRVAIEPKLVELLSDAVPRCRRAGYLLDPQTRTLSDAAQTVARDKGMTLVPIAVAADAAIDSAVGQLRAAGVHAVLVTVSSGLWPRRAELAQALRQARMPTVFERPSAAQTGALIGYGPDPQRQYEQSARYVARILRGEDANRFPVLSPDRLLLEVNLRTAQSLGLGLPLDLLRRATTVVR